MTPPTVYAELSVAVLIKAAIVSTSVVGPAKNLISKSMIAE